VKSLIRKWFPEEPDVAVAVAMAESQLVPTASNWKDSHRGCNGSFGIFQIACIHDSRDELYDVEYNIKRAREIYDTIGRDGKPVHWKPWGAYTDGRYLAYLQ